MLTVRISAHCGFAGLQPKLPGAPSVEEATLLNRKRSKIRSMQIGMAMDEFIAALIGRAVPMWERPLEKPQRGPLSYLKLDAFVFHKLH